MANPPPLIAPPQYAGFISANNTQGSNPRQQGVFGLHPLATPKYAVGKPRSSEFVETMARMFIALPKGMSTTDYINTLPNDAQTRALARVLTSDGQSTPTGFIDFFLQQAQESFAEKYQVDEVIADNYVAFMFGQKAPVFQYSGTLLNSQQDDQRTGFALAYQYMLRGSQLARRNAIVRLRYDSVIIEGTLIAASQVMNAEMEMAVPFNFAILVKTYLIQYTSQFTKLSASQFVQLSTPFIASSALGKNIARPSDVRVRTTAVLPSTLSATSVAGQDESPPSADAGVSAPQNLVDNVQSQQQPSSATSGVLGTVTPAAPQIPANASFPGVTQ